VLSKAKESVQKIIGGTPSADSAAPEADEAAAAAAEEDEAPLPYEEPPPEDGDTDEPDWSMNHADANADADYEPFDGEQVVRLCAVLGVAPCCWCVECHRVCGC
jgi:hypothetical protein